MELVREIRDIDSDEITINVPEGLRRKRVEIIMFPLKDVGKKLKKRKPTVSGLCGLWKDDRSPEAIINEIYSHRTGFGGREVSYDKPEY
jgi:hypothetical protein